MPTLGLRCGKQAGKRLLGFALPFIFCTCVLATSWVKIVSTGVTAGLIPNRDDCRSEDKSIKAVRIDDAVLDEDGRETEQWTYSYDDDGKVQKSERVVVHYDASGLPIEVSTYDMQADPRKAQQRSIYSYDSERRMVKSLSFDEDGKLYSWGEAAYDSKGNEVLYTSFGDDGQPDSVTKTTYDEAQRMVARGSTSTRGIPDQMVRFVYDANGRRVEEISTMPETTVRTLSTL